MSEPEPNVSTEGVPFCAEDRCGQYDGKRCGLMGCRPGLICEPAVKAMADRQSVHLAQIARLSQSVPLESEVAEALSQRGALLAEIGTLKATLSNWQQQNFMGDREIESLRAALASEQEARRVAMETVERQAAHIAHLRRLADERGEELERYEDDIDEHLPEYDIAPDGEDEDRAGYRERIEYAGRELASLRAKVAAMDETLRNVAFYLRRSGLAAQCAPSLIEQLEPYRASVGEKAGE